MTSRTFTLPTFNATLFEARGVLGVDQHAEPGLGRGADGECDHHRQRRGEHCVVDCGGGKVTEGGVPSFTVSYTGATLAEGNTVSITLAFAPGDRGGGLPRQLLEAS